MEMLSRRWKKEMAKGYAYLDNTDLRVLHVVDDVKTAEEFTGGKIEEVDLDYEYGYPLDADGKHLVVYATGREKEGRPVPAQIAELVERLK